jgi:hypothetical protein
VDTPRVCTGGVARWCTAGGEIASRAMAAVDQHDADTSGRMSTRKIRLCAWCGRRLPEDERAGRRRRYCAQPCRQRAYERRTAVQRGGLPEDAVVLSSAELADLQDRLFQLRCAAQDVVTAADDGAEGGELRRLAVRVVCTAEDLERLR